MLTKCGKQCIEDPRCNIASSASRYRYAKRQISDLNRAMQTHAQIQDEIQSQIQELQKLPENITVLFLAANPIDTHSLRLDAEARAIQETIRKSEYRDTLRFETRWAVRTSDILQTINEVKNKRGCH